MNPEPNVRNWVVTSWSAFGSHFIRWEVANWVEKRSLGREQTPSVIKSASPCWVLTTGVWRYGYNVMGRPVRREVKEIDRVSGAE